MNAADAEPDMAPAVICEPGNQRCAVENTAAIETCNASGTAWVEGSCPTSPMQVCRQDACVEVACIPGTRRCESPTLAQVCNAEGTGFEDADTCTGASQCEEGNCLSRCDLAERNNSYIGCEYWAVELENHLLSNNEDNPLPEEERPPFAIVLANPSPTYDARITVYEADGQIANALGSRLVGTDTPLPGIDLVTVESDVVGPDGRQLFTIDGPIDNIVLPRGSLMTLVMPFRDVPFGQTSVTRSAYRVTSNQPVIAYQFNPLCCNYNYTNDASLLLPTSALTENYMFMGYAVFAGTPQSRLTDPFAATMTVIATEPDTTVTVQLAPSKDGARDYADIIYPVTSGQVTGPDANGRITATLQPHDVLNVAAKGAAPVDDLTGSRVRANKPVSVFGGHTCAFVPFTAPACDHMESQLFPVETWGTNFVAAPLKLRRDPEDMTAMTREGTYWKFVAYQNDTVIDTGRSIALGDVLPPADEGVRPCVEFSDDGGAGGKFTLDAGQTCEFGTVEMFGVQATAPIMLGAFLSGQNSVKVDAEFGDHAGDPAFFLVPPQEQFRTEYSFLTPATYFQSYLTVLTRPGFSVTLDGEEIDLTLLEEGAYVVDEQSGWARAHLEVEPGPHRVEATVPFGIVVYGYDDYVSYAYTGGLDLTKLNTFE